VTNPPPPPLGAAFWSVTFRAKGVWNCVISVALFFGDDSLRQWTHAAPADPGYRVMFLALAFVFGIGYWRVGQSLTRHRDTVRGGVLGQIAVFLVAAYEVLIAARLPWAFLVPGVVDLIFAILFAVFLWTTARDGPTPDP